MINKRRWNDQDDLFTIDSSLLITNTTSARYDVHNLQSNYYLYMFNSLYLTLLSNNRLFVKHNGPNHARTSHSDIALAAANDIGALDPRQIRHNCKKESRSLS